jgi:hypothetical protein
MAIFLLIYIIICLVWLFWAGILTYLTLRYRYPDKQGIIMLLIFWAVSITILVISATFMARADWTTVPKFLQSVTATY